MRISVFSTKPYDKSYLSEYAGEHVLDFQETKLDASTASLAEGSQAICVFVNDRVDAATLERIAQAGVKLVLLRCAGFNNVDVKAAYDLSIAVGRVPAYSPHAVAEHTVGMMLALNRRLHRAYNRVREGNFALDGLLGFDMLNKTVGVVGTGAIGAVVCRILLGFGCKVVATDPVPSEEVEALGVRYLPLEELFATSDITTLHCPLSPATYHLVDDRLIAGSKDHLMLINTSRGALVDTRAVIEALKQQKIGSLGLDVYEEEAELFFENLSGKVLTDDVFARLLTFPNVLITGHQAFFTHEALSAIAATTFQNVDAYVETGAPLHPVTREMVR